MSAILKARASNKSVVFLDPYQFTTSNRNTQFTSSDSRVRDSRVKWQKTKADDDGGGNASLGYIRVCIQITPCLHLCVSVCVFVCVCGMCKG